MSDYTPTTQDVREAWLTAEYEERDSNTSDDEIRAEFNRWFQSEIEKAARRGAEEALRIVKDEWYPDE